MLLSLDWDYCSGSVEHVFDSPLWGTPDGEHDRVARWRERAHARDPRAQGWEVLAGEFPLYDDAQGWLVYQGVPTFVAWSHAHAWNWLERYPGREVYNFDSHHDLFSQSGEKTRVRPGNWAGLALREGLITRYHCVYPVWHEQVRVSEGFDLERTLQEAGEVLEGEILSRIDLSRTEPGRVSALPHPRQVEAVLLVQSPSWTNPAHDNHLLGLARALNAGVMSEVYSRPWTP